jgi:hypothetical protein
MQDYGKLNDEVCEIYYGEKWILFKNHGSEIRKGASNE